MTLFKKNGKSNSNSGTAARKDSALLNLRRIFIGVLFGSVVFVLLTLIFSLVMTLGAIPDSAALVFAFFVDSPRFFCRRICGIVEYR